MNEKYTTWLTWLRGQLSIQHSHSSLPQLLKAIVVTFTSVIRLGLAHNAILYSLECYSPPTRIPMPQRESGRLSRPSKRARRAQGLPSSSEASGDDSDSEAPRPSATQSTSSPTVPKDRRERFEIRYKTATLSNSDVLSELAIFLQFILLIHSCLAAQIASWSAECYSHFKMPPGIVVENDKVKYIFVCKT